MRVHTLSRWSKGKEDEGSAHAVQKKPKPTELTFLHRKFSPLSLGNRPRSRHSIACFGAPNGVSTG